MGKTVLQYYCGNCNNILKKVESEIQLSHSIESCPRCGTLLSNTIQNRPINKKLQSSSTVFQKASEIPKLILDIPKIDSILHFITPNQKLCIIGIHTQKIIERLCVRAQLPHRYGGLNSNVLLVDGANSSDFYQCVNFAQQYGMDTRKVLSQITSSRTFTVYQLANTIIHELKNAVKQYDTKFVVISNLLHFFTNDPYLDTKEMKAILKQIIKSLQRIENCVIVISLGFPTQYDDIVLDMFSKIIQITANHNALSVHINDDGIQNSVIMTKQDLEIVPH